MQRELMLLAILWLTAGIVIGVTVYPFLMGDIESTRQNNESNKHAPFVLSPTDESYHTVTLQANNRLVLTNRNLKDERKVVCAEPFPEGASESERFSEALLELGERKVESEQKNIFNVTLPHPMPAAVKFYRDGVFALCQAAMNKWISTYAEGDDRRSSFTMALADSEINKETGKIIDDGVYKAFKMAREQSNNNTINILGIQNELRNELLKDEGRSETDDRDNAIKQVENLFQGPDSVRQSQDFVNELENTIDEFIDDKIDDALKESNLKISSKQKEEIRNITKDINIDSPDKQRQILGVLGPPSQFEYQLEELSKATVKMMEADTEARKAEAEARIKEAEARIKEAEAKKAEADQKTDNGE